MRILLVDDHPIVREGYRRLLERQEGYRVVAEAETAEDAFEAYCKHRPDIVLLDISLSDASGIEALRRIKQEDPLARILMFTMHDNINIAKKTLYAGARGYVTKNATPTELLDAVAKVARNNIALSSDVAQALAVEHVADGCSPFDGLTSREIDIFKYLVEGNDVNDIAKLLNLSTKTVHNYRTQIKFKLDVSTDAQLVLLALEHGFIKNICACPRS